MQVVATSSEPRKLVFKLRVWLFRHSAQNLYMLIVAAGWWWDVLASLTGCMRYPKARSFLILPPVTEYTRIRMLQP